MKGYVGAVMQIPQSVEVANRCIESGKKFGVDVKLIPAVHKSIALDELNYMGIKMSTFEQSYSDVGAVIGNFITQFKIWRMIYESNQPGIVLEHDAVFVAPIPPLEGDIINLGKPSYGRFNTKDKPGIYPMFSKDGGYIPGAHGYYVTPAGARLLVETAQQIGAAPVDIYLNKTTFPDIKELYPWVIEARDNFSTIQKEKGCKAKHNYNKDYKLI